MKTTLRSLTAFWIYFTMLFGMVTLSQAALPVATYHADGDAQDSTSNHHGTKASDVTYATGRLGQGFSFPGTDTTIGKNAVTIPDSTDFKPTNLTVSAWVNFSSLTTITNTGSSSSVQFIITKQNTRAFSVGYSFSYYLAKNAGNRFTFGADLAPGVEVAATGTTPVVPGRWYYVVGTYDHSSFKLYVNGKLEAQTAETRDLEHASTPLYLGRTNSSDYDFLFKGTLDEVKLYDTALTPSQIPALDPDNVGTGLVSWWRGNGDANDAQGSNNGTLQNGATFAAGRVGQAFNLSETTGDYVSIPDSPSLHVNQLTIDAWVNFKSLPSHSVSIFGKALGGNNANSYALWYQGGALHGYTEGSSSSQPLSYTWTPTTDQWYHVAYTFDGSSHKLYVDGAEVAAGANTSPPGYDTHPALIGADYSASNIVDFFDGKIDEVDLFDRALSGSEINAIYTAGATGKSTAPSVTIADASCIPGSSGTTNMVFKVTVARPNASPVTVDYQTADGSAVAPTDYSPVFNDTLTIPANTTSATITVPVSGSAATFPRSFYLTLSNPSNATLNRTSATGTLFTGNAVNDFLPNTNTASQLWQYGYAATDGTGFALLDGNPRDSTATVWNKPSVGDIGIVYNSLGTVLHYNIGTYQPVDELALFENNDGKKAVLRWLAPASGTYQVDGLFEGIESAGGATTSDVSIVKNGNAASPLLFNAGDSSGLNYLNGYQVQKPFSFTVTVVAGDTLDFLVGWGSNNQYSFDGTGLKVTILPSSAQSLPAITTFSKTGPSVPGGNIHFTCSTQAGVNVRVQSSTTPATEGSWTDLTGGGAMTESPAGTYTLDTTGYPLVNGLYFRFISSKANYTDGKSSNTGLGPNNLANTLTFSATGPASAGAPILFGATTASGWTVRVQVATTASPVEGDWSDLNDGNSGRMTESSTTAGSYSLNTTSFPVGATVRFRAIASKTSQTDLKSVALGPFNLHQAVLSIGAKLTSTSDFANGYTAYIDDYLIYKLTFKNSGDAPAKSLRVTATVPTFKYADIPLMVKTTTGSTTVTLASGDTSQLAVGGNIVPGPGLGGSVVGPSGFISSSATITSITDATHFVISQAATGALGTKTISALVQYGAASKQFKASDISLSPGGSYVPETSTGANDAKLVWNVGDLPGAVGFVYSQYVTFSVHITGKVAVDQSIGIGNDYKVASTASPKQPITDSTGFLSSSPNVSCRINGNISFLLNPLATTVAPGGLMTYVFSLSNKGTTAATNPVAVVEVPDNTRFANAYPNGTLGVVGVGTVPTSKIVYHTGNPLPQLVLKFPSLAAKTTVQVKVTFQAKWADPTEVLKISTINYGASFLNPTAPSTIVTQFNTLFTAASSVSTTPSTTDFFAFISDPVNKLARSLNQSGVVNVSLSGSLDAQPKLDVWKQISNSITKSDDDGDGIRIDLVKPGEKMTFMIVLVNNGSSPADEVYVTERMPDHCTYVAKSAILFGATTPSKTKSTLTVTPDPDGHHLLFTGFHLEPKDSVSITYTVLVDGTLTVPPPTDPPLLLTVGDFSIGSGSTTTTPAGFATARLIKVIGTAQLYAQPRADVMIQKPRVSSNVNTTAATLDSLYSKTPSALPITDPKNLISYIDGVERYYAHYENFSNVGASGVKITVPLPANTAFYRASWVALTPDTNPGALPTMPGTLVAPPVGGSITAPTKLATSGNIVFNLATLAAAGKGDVMVEVIVTPSAVQLTGSKIGSDTELITITDSSAPASAHPVGRTSSHSSSPFPSNHQARLNNRPVIVSDPAHVPDISLARIISTPNVVPGSQFDITYVAMNQGDIATNGILDFTVPANTMLLSVDRGFDVYTPTPTESQPGSTLSWVMVGNNLSSYNPGQSLLPHTAGTITAHFQVTGAAGSSIVEDTSVLRADYHVPVLPAPATIHIVTSQALKNLSTDSQWQTFGINFSTLTNGVRIVDIKGGQVVAQGAGNVVAAGAGNLLTQDGAGVVAAGAGNVMAVEHPINFGTFPPISGLIAGNSLAITQGKLGNLIVQDGSSVVAAGAGNVVAAGAGNVVSAGAGNVVAQGAGNLVSTNGGNVVAQGAGNVVAAGAGNIIAAGAGNVVAAGAGNIVASGAGNVVAQGAGNVVSAGAGN